VKPARYIFLNLDLRMSPGKAAAQAAHAEMLATYALFGAEYAENMSWINRQRELWDVWFGWGHYAKYVMKADDATQMYTIQRYLDDRGFRTYMVIDEGHTEGTVFVPTAMAAELVDKDDERTASIFGEFKLYREPLSPKSPGIHIEAGSTATPTPIAPPRTDLKWWQGRSWLPF